MEVMLTYLAPVKSIDKRVRTNCSYPEFQGTSIEKMGRSRVGHNVVGIMILDAPAQALPANVHTGPNLIQLFYNGSQTII